MTFPTKQKLLQSLSSAQANYYSELYREHNYSPLAVASGKQIYKDLRYKKLSAIFEGDENFSIYDVGMGLGHYYEYIKSNFPEKKISYSGSEVVQEFFDYCMKTYPECTFFLSDLSQTATQNSYDYFIFGGTFYHPVKAKQKEWDDFVFSMLENAFSRTKKGLAVNFITEYCDFYDRELYYAKISKLTDFITSKLSRFFSIDHSYALYEYTLYIYQSEHIRSKYKDKDFDKYF